MQSVSPHLRGPASRGLKGHRVYTSEATWVQYAAWAGILFGLLAGCAYEWRKPGAADASLRRDEAGCRDFARMNYPQEQLRLGTREVQRKINNRIVSEYEYFPASYVMSVLFARCMEKKGYEAVRKPAE